MAELQGAVYFILTLFIVYGVLSVFAYYYGMEVSNSADINSIPKFSESFNPLDYIVIIFEYIGFYFSMIFFTISELPFWFNVIIFTPFGATLLYIILTLIRG